MSLRRTIAVRLDSAGDMVLNGPAFAALAQVSDHLTLWCGERGAQAAEAIACADDVIVATAPWIDPSPRRVDPAETAALVDRLRAGEFDTAVIFTSERQSALPAALLLRLAGVRRIGAICDDYPGSLVDIRLRSPDDVHEIERALRLAEAVGGVSSPSPWLRPRMPAVALPHRYVVLHPGTDASSRAWPPGHWRALAAELGARHEAVVVTGSESERDLTRYVARPGQLDLAGRTSFSELAGVLDQADALVCGNSGPAHLAAALGTPVVSLFAATVDPARWAPAGPGEVLMVHVPCAGCHLRRCPVLGHPCMSEIGPMDALRALDRVHDAEVAPV